MRKTRSNRRRMGNRTMCNPHCGYTFHGLHLWYEHMFEKLGWMILAQGHHMTDKISVYIESLHRLDRAIKNKIHSIHDKDKKKDLMIMSENLQCLINHAHKDFH